MDVKYIPSDWDKMKDGIGDLIGLGRWGKGMIDELKDLSDNLEDAEADIANYDSDGVISFHHTSQKNRYQGLFEDFKVLHSFTGKVGDIVDRTIDQPFYEDMDAFVEAMRDLSISNYTTKNRLGVTETQFVYAGNGPAQSFEVAKTEVSLDDLFNGDNFYSGQMKLEYEAWQELNPDKDFTQEEYQQAALNTRAFEYESIRDQQENEEFWVQLGAMVVIVGVSIIFFPAGLALGAAYGAMELSSAVSGKDWISGRELGTEERWVRGLLSPLDIVPGISGLTKFSSTIRLVSIGENMGQLGIKAGVKGSLNSGASKVNQLLKTAEQHSAARLRSAASAIKDGTNVAKNKIARDIVEVARLGDSGHTLGKNLFSSRSMGLEMVGIGDVGKVPNPVENTHAMENWTTEILSNIKGINFGSGSTKGTGIADKSVSENAMHLNDVKIPSVRNNEFNKWFDNISVKEFEEMWNHPQMRCTIEDRIRRPGGYHEWHLVARTPKFKQWEISMDDIKEMRSLTKDVEFVNPPGRHGRRGSTKAHNEILKIIDSASDYESFVKGLNEWAKNRMKNGIMDLPKGLRR